MSVSLCLSNPVTGRPAFVSVCMRLATAACLSFCVLDLSVV